MFFLALAAVLFALHIAFVGSTVHDYRSYLKQWNAVMQGMDPWHNPKNAYGPVYNTLAMLYSMHPKLPRLVFAGCYFIAAFYLAFIAHKNTYLPAPHKYGLYALLFFNPLFWIFTVRYGINDAFMAFFVVFALILFNKHKDSLAGFFMAIAIGIKLMPIVMLPFLIISRTHLRWRFAIATIVTLVVIFGVSYYLWGNSVWHPFEKSYDRNSKMLSIFRFLRGEYSPLRLFMDKPNFDWASVYVCLAALFALFCLHIHYRFEHVLSSIIALGILLTLYKVGHQQFYITLIMLLVLWVSLDYKKIMDSGGDLTSVFTFVIWLAFISFLYFLTAKKMGSAGYKGPFSLYRDIVGLPTFLVSAWLLIDLIRHSLRLPGARADKN